MNEEEIKEKVVEVIKTIFDPELPVNILELGLIYKIEVNEGGNVFVLMTLTAPGCPAAQSLPLEVDEKVRAVEGVSDVLVTVTWDPPWNKSMMSEVAQLELGFM
ncbi:iron-sulfur cluster assembly protein [Niabella yanshanensis]|uniref:Iron-sulfur cluster assembly protein n=1 Tax=Niabella yanshanensis TaxID=577386 RepID=A0ABZ0W8K1_9BACT|nr:iron-sulfur cluster assembly protein [Niabella yanshanensis]WQD38460.1 iron-sulfur cluster assembly protein [Niabella yanshanensis]